MKCVKMKIPIAKTALFTNIDGSKDLKFKMIEKDKPERPEKDEGYYGIGSGDSGNGYMVTDGTDADMRYTFLALVGQSNITLGAMGTYDTSGGCREWATKLTHEMIDWVVAMVMTKL